MGRAIVIGTGFGGAVTACRLAQAGLDVTVLERGRRYDERGDAYPRAVYNDWLWSLSRGLFDVRATTAMQVVQAAGYGGGSLIYANVHLRMPAAAFNAARWPDGYSRAALDPYYDLVAWMLDLTTIGADGSTLPRKTAQTRDALVSLARGGQRFDAPIAVRLGDPDAPPQPNKHGAPQRGCSRCGECVMGCTTRAKNTLDRNYLHVAEQRGAVMRTGCEVTRIEARAGGGYVVRFRDHEGGVDAALEGDYVFVCAGALNSTELLLRSRDALPGLSPRLGERYSGNGDAPGFVFDTRATWEPADGPTITTGVLYDRDEGEERAWFVVEEGGFSQHLAPLVALARPALDRDASSVSRSRAVGGSPEALHAAAAQPKDDAPPTPADIEAWYRSTAQATFPSAENDALRARDATRAESIDPLAEKTAHTALFLAMGRDHADGRVELLANNETAIRWDVRGNLGLYDLEERLMRDVAGALGGAYASTPFWRYARLPVTVHSLGGCAMGRDASTGVTDDGGEVFNHRGLFVMDGAILPTATGVNPAHTIAAVAERNVERFIQRVTGDARWTAPERAHATRYDDPLSHLDVPAGGTTPPVTRAFGLSFEEGASGAWTRGGGDSAGASMLLTVVISDVDRFLADRYHLAVAVGTLSLDGLTPPGGAPVLAGAWNLFLPHGDARELRYALPFHAADGRRCTLFGEKVFHPGEVLGLWREVTTMEARVHEGADARGALLGRATLHVNLAAALKTAVTLRESGPRELVGRARALVEFLEFYVRGLAG